jgi:hypothetical protein
VAVNKFGIIDDASNEERVLQKQIPIELISVVGLIFFGCAILEGLPVANEEEIVLFSHNKRIYLVYQNPHLANIEN